MFNLIKYPKFVVEIKPARKTITDEQLLEIAEHLKQEEGLTIEEIETLLDWTVENTKRNLEKHRKISNENDDLWGSCGFAQTSSLYPFEQVRGISVLYNSTLNYPLVINDLVQHAFGIITFPLKTYEGIINKSYIVDVTYKQFFLKMMCEKPHFKSDGTYELYPGYYMFKKPFKTKTTEQTAKKILRNGYIELTDETLKAYIDGFALSSIMSTNQDKLFEWKEQTPDECRKYIRQIKPFEREFDEYDLQSNGYNIKLPEEFYQLNKTK